MVNRGVDEGVKENDHGVFVGIVRLKGKDPQYHPIAKGRVVKLTNGRSVWVLYKVLDKKMISRKQELFLLNESKLLEGRKKLTFDRNLLVGSKRNLKKNVKDYLEEGNELAKKKDEYKVIKVNHKKQKAYEKDITLIDVNRWEEDQFSGRYKKKAIFQSANAKEFSRRKNIQTYEKMVAQMLSKFNRPGTNSEFILAEQKRGSSGLLPEKGVYGNTYSRYIEAEQKAIRDKKKFYADIANKGDTWSDDYSDEELSDVLYNIGRLKEKERRSELLAYRYNYQAYGSFGVNLINNENLNDAENTEDSKYDLEVGLEGYLFKEFDRFKRFTLELSLRRAQDSYFGGVVNVVSNELSAAGQINWYPFGNPNSIETNIVYVGMLFRYGLSRVSIKSTEEEGNYQVTSLPGLKIGLKYNFANTIGFRLAYGVEQINAERIVKSADNGNLPDRAQYIEGRLSVGVSKFF